MVVVVVGWLCDLLAFFAFWIGAWGTHHTHVFTAARPFRNLEGGSRLLDSSGGSAVTRFSPET